MALVCRQALLATACAQGIFIFEMGYVLINTLHAIQNVLGAVLWVVSENVQIGFVVTNGNAGIFVRALTSLAMESAHLSVSLGMD